MLMVMATTRKGRKRKSGRRSPCGDLIKEKRPDDRLLASLQPHRRDLPEKHRLSEKATTVLGKLNLFGWITDEQWQAGNIYKRGVNAYRAVIGSIDPLNSPAPGFSGEITPEEARHRKEVYDLAFEALDAVGNVILRTVNRAAIYDSPDYGSLELLKRGLTTLERHYGLTAGRK